MNLIRNGLIVSLIANGILLSFVFGLIPFLLYMAALMNVALAWYIYFLIREIKEYNTDMVKMLDAFASLQEHIESVHEMEMFYGEPVLQGMIEHMGNVGEEINFYLDKYSSEEEEQELGPEE